ncbi:MAG: lipopolysaccharide biosynthesis protein [Egibacteraceae bacterium]
MGLSEGNGPGPGGGDQPSLTAQTASGLRWSYLSSMGLAASTLVYTALISRLLSPFAFGLIAMANLVVIFTDFFARMGLAQALIQKPELSKEEIRAGSSAGLALGVLCFAAIWLLAPTISGVFHEPALRPVLRVMGGSFLFTGLGMTGQGLLRRELRIRELSIIRVVTYAFGYLIVGVGLAALGAGVWSIVAGALVSTGSQAIWQLVILRHPIRPVFRREPYRALYGYGVRASGIRLMEYLGNNLDTFVVARIARTALLGQYNRAFFLVTQPLTRHLATALTTVLFPSFSRIQEDTTRARRAYLSVLGLAGIILFPICAGMAVAARELVLVVLGGKWDVAATIVPWFALAGGFNVMSKFSELLTEARAALNKALLLQGCYLLLLGMLLSVAAGFRSHGVWVFAAALAAGEIVRHVAYLGLMRRIVELSTAQVWQSYAPAAFASTGVALGVAVTRGALVGNVPTLWVVAAEVGTGAIALALCVRFCPVPHVRRELRERLSQAGMLGRAGGWRWRLAPLVLGPPRAATAANTAGGAPRS